jgi:hypothetical protein
MLAQRSGPCIYTLPDSTAPQTSVPYDDDAGTKLKLPSGKRLATEKNNTFAASFNCRLFFFSSSSFSLLQWRCGDTIEPAFSFLKLRPHDTLNQQKRESS